MSVGCVPVGFEVGACEFGLQKEGRVSHALTFGACGVSCSTESIVDNQRNTFMSHFHLLPETTTLYRTTTVVNNCLLIQSILRFTSCLPFVV